VELNPSVWIRDARQYALDVRSEFRKVTWPMQKEYVGGTIGVLVIVGIIGAVLGLIDVGLGQLMRLVVP
jgi:preprotein translocase subunit SecE